MIFACYVQAAALLLEEYIFGRSSFFIGYLLVTVGIIISGILPLLIPSVRISFFEALARIQDSIPVLFVIEFL